MHADEKNFNMGKKSIGTMKGNLKSELRDLVKDSDDEIIRNPVNEKISSRGDDLDDLMITDKRTIYDKHSVDNDLEQLTNLVTSLMDKNKKNKIDTDDSDDELNMLEYSNSEVQEQRVTLSSSNDYDVDINSLLMSQKNKSETFNYSYSETDKRPTNDILD